MIETDVKTLLRFQEQPQITHFITNLDGSAKAVSLYGIPFSEADLIPSEVGATDSFYISIKLPSNVSATTAKIKYSDGSIEQIGVNYIGSQNAITGFTNNNIQSILIS